MEIRWQNRVLVGVTAMAMTGTAWAAQPATQPMASEYEVIASRSIFLRARTIAKPIDPPPPPPPGEPSFVLRGVVFEGNAFRAYLEGPDGGGLLRLAVGDRVAGGVVVEIGMDGIRYQKNGSDESIWVIPGRKLTGSVTNLMETRR